MTEVVAIVLAAGASSRFGSPKLLADVNGRPVIAETLRRVVASAVDRIVVVTRSDAVEIGRIARMYGASVATNPDADSGQASSIGVGVTAAGDAGAAIMLLADQPTIDPDAIDAVIDRWRNGASIARVKYADGFGHPVLFDRSWFSELDTLTGDAGARGIIRRHADCVVHADLSHLTIPRDIDTPADLQAIRGIVSAECTSKPERTNTSGRRVPMGFEDKIKEHMPVVCSNGGQFATVDHLDEGDTIKLTRDDEGNHHWIPMQWVKGVDTVVRIDRPGDQAMEEWSTTPPSALHDPKS